MLGRRLESLDGDRLTDQYPMCWTFHVDGMFGATPEMLVRRERGLVTSLELVAALHPSAAVGGTPTTVATELIAEIEGMDRGRYAGPVGWIDASGDGEWGIALRSARLSGATVRLFAGCGIVADSDPEAELAEAQAKFVPVRDALTAG